MTPNDLLKIAESVTCIDAAATVLILAIIFVLAVMRL